MKINAVGLVGIANAADPEKTREILTFDPDAFARSMKASRDERDANTPPVNQADLRREYNQLRQKLFDLQQNARAFETRTNEAAGKIRLLEQRINETLKLKKAASDAGNFRGERSYEHGVQLLESELLDAKEEFSKNNRWSTHAARDLRTFNGHGRIAELKALLDGEGLPVAKSEQTGPK